MGVDTDVPAAGVGRPDTDDQTGTIDESQPRRRTPTMTTWMTTAA
jgi:hypothetical protein